MNMEKKKGICRNILRPVTNYAGNIRGRLKKEHPRQTFEEIEKRKQDKHP